VRSDAGSFSIPASTGSGTLPAGTPREVHPVYPSGIVLAAGKPVTSAAFRPRIEFTPPIAGWWAMDDQPDAFFLVDSTYHTDLLHAEEDVTIAIVQVALDGPCEYSKTSLLERKPDALIRHLQASPYLEVSAPQPRNIAGYTGVTAQVTVKKEPVDACNYTDFPPKNKAVFLFPLGGDAMVPLRPESAMRIITLDVQARPVTIVVEWNRANPSSEADANLLLDSVRFPL
jgi:hypothetical protein